jgi:hypothetical protein
VEGELTAGGTVFYVLKASKGQEMVVEIWSPNGDVYLGITGLNDGKTQVDTSDEETEWSGVLPETQEYLIEVTAGGGQTSYSLEVVIEPLLTEPVDTPAPGAFDPYTTWGDPDFVDDFDLTSTMNWASPGQTLPNTPNILFTFEDNQIYVTGRKLGFSTWWFSWPELEDFYLELKATPLTCSGKDAYGLIFRGPPHQAGVSYGYVVAFTCDGNYFIYRLDSGDPFIAADLASLAESEYIAKGTGNANVFGVLAEGDSLVFYANGHKIAEVTDDTYPAGRYGLFVRASETIDFTYRPDKLAYWDLSE